MSEEKMHYIPLPPAYGIPLVVINTLSAILSIVGSSSVMYMAAKRNFFQQILQRLMFYISLSDICLSITILIMPFVLPASQLDLTYAAFGNETTCSVFGFMLGTFVWTSGCYNCFLSLYFLATVRYQWKEPSNESTFGDQQRFCNLKKIPSWEIGAHVATLVVPLLLMSVGLAYDAIHPQSLLPICYLSTTIPNHHGAGDTSTTAINETVVFVVVGMASFLLGVVVLVSLGATFFLYWTVRQKMKQSSNFLSNSMMASRTSANTHNRGGGRVRYQNNNSVTKSNNDSHTTDTARMIITSSVTSQATNPGCTGTTTNNSTTEQQEDPFLKRTLQVRTQAILYALVYCNSIVWFLLLGGVTIIMDPATLQREKTSPGLYTLQLLAVTFGPLVGFGNFFVYTRPKVVRWKTVTDNKESLWWIGKQILKGTKIPTSAAAHRRKKQQQAALANELKNNKNQQETNTPDNTAAISGTTPSATSTVKESTVVVQESVAFSTTTTNNNNNNTDQESFESIIRIDLEDGLLAKSHAGLSKAASLPVLQQGCNAEDPKSQTHHPGASTSQCDGLSKAVSVPATLRRTLWSAEDSQSQPNTTEELGNERDDFQRC